VQALLLATGRRRLAIRFPRAYHALCCRALGIGVEVHGAPSTRQPTLFVANHTNWWDGFLAYLVTRRLGLTFQVLMDAEQLGRYRTFLRLGGLPIRRGRARQAYADLRAAGAYLRPGAGLWIFPQGARRPPGERPERCERGAAHLALTHRGPLRVCPVAFRYGFVSEQLPEAFALLGEAWVFERGAAERRDRLMARLEERLGETLDALDALVGREALDAFRPLARGRLSVNKRLDRFRHAAGLLRGPFQARNG
jgi:1-acyl-sn-glycerol-3-phosphate acyltransferase